MIFDLAAAVWMDKDGVLLTVLGSPLHHGKEELREDEDRPLGDGERADRDSGDLQKAIVVVVILSRAVRA